ncbi:MFS transporter [Atopobacter sp. AH10]|uniref:MFS transporter n=1 Tax=Atopobacter sp. AH10 TaxID=2315861 RepID=UPI000EF275EF|nr:MFS transporter [Atopobacter sp. AH10]RLK63263.1 MFS transporter [Atopobacter sp. AH10]
MNQNKSKLMLLTGNALGQFGSSILSFVLGLYILKKLKSVLLYSVSQMIGPLAALVLLPVLGAIVDKYNKNRIIRVSQMISCLAIISFILINRLGYTQFISIVLLLIVLKLSDQFLSTTLNSATISIVQESEIQSFRSSLQLMQALSMVLSPIIAVFIYDKFALLGVLLVEVVMEFLVLVIYWGIDFRHQETREEIKEQSLLALFKSGIRFIAQYKKIVFGLVFVLAINFILGIVNVGLPFLQLNILALSNKAFAINDSILAIGLLLGSLLTAKIRSQRTLNIARHAISLIALATCVLGLFLQLNLSKSIWPVVIGGYFFILGLAITTCNILISSWSMVKIPQEFQGRVFAVLNALTQVSLPLSMLLFGYLFDLASSVDIFLTSGIALLVVTFLLPGLFGINLRSDELE